jgi:hypothetical protein
LPAYALECIESSVVALRLAVVVVAVVVVVVVAAAAAAAAAAVVASIATQMLMWKPTQLNEHLLSV